MTDLRPLQFEESIREIVRAQAEAMRLPKTIRREIPERDKRGDPGLDVIIDGEGFRGR